MASLSWLIDSSMAASLSSTALPAMDSSSSTRRYRTVDGTPASFADLSQRVAEPMSKSGTTSPGPT